MRIFISNKFKEVNKKELRKKLEKIISVLEKNGYQTLNSFRDMGNWQEKELPPGKAISWAFKKIKKCDAILCFIDTPEKSQGMLIEFGFAKALGKKTILLISDNLSSPTLEAAADQVIRFRDLDDIAKKLNTIKI